MASCANKCGPDNACIYVQPTALGFYVEVNGGSTAIYSYSHGDNCTGGTLYPGIRNWMGNECNFASALAGTLWVR